MWFVVFHGLQIHLEQIILLDHGNHIAQGAHGISQLLQIMLFWIITSGQIKTVVLKHLVKGQGSSIPASLGRCSRLVTS